MLNLIMSEAGQMTLDLRKRGGVRKGAGRPKRSPETVPHVPRPRLAGYHPVHVNWHCLPHIPNLREPERRRMLEGIFRAAKDRFGCRLVHYAIQSNHLDLVVEAEDGKALTR